MKNNFAVLLAKKMQSVSSVNRKTGISRVTLTNLYYKREKGIRYDTLEKICECLECSPRDFFIQEN